MELSHHLDRRHRGGRILDVAGSVPNQDEGTRLDRRIPTKRIQGYCPPLIPEVCENWLRYECDPGLLIVDYASIAGTCENQLEVYKLLLTQPEPSRVLRVETRTVLVTGGAGFMGSWLVDELITRGHEVVSVDNLLGGSERNVHKDCKFVKADMRIRDRVKEVVKGVDMIFQLAAYAAEGQSIFSPVAINEINIVPMNNLLVEAINNGVESFE